MERHRTGCAIGRWSGRHLGSFGLSGSAELNGASGAKGFGGRRWRRSGSSYSSRRAALRSWRHGIFVGGPAARGVTESASGGDAKFRDSGQAPVGQLGRRRRPAETAAGFSARLYFLRFGFLPGPELDAEHPQAGSGCCAGGTERSRVRETA